MDPIVAYLKNDELLGDRIEVRILRLRAACYVIYENKLYRRGYSMPLFKCITPTKMDYITRQIHEGICGNHVGG